MMEYEGKCLGKVRMKWAKCPKGLGNCTNCLLFVRIKKCDSCGRTAHHAVFYRDTGEPIVIYCVEHLIMFKNTWDIKSKNQRIRM